MYKNKIHKHTKKNCGASAPLRYKYRSKATSLVFGMKYGLGKTFLITRAAATRFIFL